MKLKKEKINIWLLLASIFGVMSIVADVFGIIAVSINLFGVQDAIYNMLQSAGNNLSDIESQITFEILSLVLNCLINLYYVTFYIKGCKYRLNTSTFAMVLIRKSIWHLLLGSGMSAIFALIAGISMNSVGRSQTPVKQILTEEDVSQLKFQAMSEAIGRLKQLRDSGVISEQEYYENLNKIIEG